MKQVFGILAVLLLLISISVYAIPAEMDHILDDTIHDSKSREMPSIGEVNAGIGATISVPDMQKEEKIENPYENYTVDEFKKLSVKKLKEFLKDRGLECKGCSEKADFVKLAFENRSVLPTTAETNATDGEKKDGINDVPDGGKIDQEKLDELLAKLKQNGFGNSQFFNVDDLRNMNPEDMASKFGGKPNKKSSSSSKTNTKKKTSSKDNAKSKKNPKSIPSFAKSSPKVTSETIEEEEQAIEL